MEDKLIRGLKIASAWWQIARCVHKLPLELELLFDVIHDGSFERISDEHSVSYKGNVELKLTSDSRSDKD